MINGKKVIVVMPAYNAAETLEQTYRELPRDVVDDVILVDDSSSDDTVVLAKTLGIEHIYVHDHNMGYGGNQKTCYARSLALGGEITIMVHPDYQYTPRLITAMASLIASDVFDCVLGSRILGVGALKGGMPLYKYVANRGLTFFQNMLVNYKLSEYHTGYRAFSSKVLRDLPLHENSDDFLFDNQMLLQIIGAGYSIGEVTCPTRYAPEASSIGGSRVVKYGWGVMMESLMFRAELMGLVGQRYIRKQ